MNGMSLCSDKHEEIIYIGRGCPLCQAVNEIERLQQQINSLNEEIIEKRECKP